MSIQFNLFSEAQWKEMYSATDYAKKTPHALNHILHYMLVHSGDETIIAFARKKINFLAKADASHYMLTPLMLSVILRREAVTQAFLDIWNSAANKSTFLNASDAAGFTVLHHAAFSTNTLFEMLLKNGIESRRATHWFGTAQDLKDLTSLESTLLAPNKVFVEDAAGRLETIQQLGPARVKEMLGFTYRDIPYVPLKMYHVFWLENCDKELRPKEALETPHFPSVTIKACKELGENQQQVVAQELIAQQTILGFYSGEFCEEKLKDDAYQMGDIDARQMGNFTRCINFGWPNCVQMESYRKGYRFTYLISLSAIQKDEPLQFNYGLRHSLALKEPHKILGSEKMHLHFKKGLAHCIQETDRAIKNQKFSAYDLYAKLRFPLEAPGALIDLHFRGSVQAQDWLNIFHSPDSKLPRFFLNWKQQFAREHWDVYSLVLQITYFEYKMAGHAHRETAVKWILDSIGTYSVIQIIKGIEMLPSYDFSSNFEALDRSVKNHIPIDPLYLLGFEERCQDMAVWNFKINGKFASEAITDAIKTCKTNYPDQPDLIVPLKRVLEILATSFGSYTAEGSSSK